MLIHKKTFAKIFSLACCCAGLVHAAPGELDRTFGQNGFFRLPTDPVRGGNEVPTSFTADSNGRLVVIGRNVTPASYAPRLESPTVFARILPGGSLDSTFAGSGVQRLTGAGGEYNVANGIFSTNNGKILMQQTRAQYCVSDRVTCFVFGSLTGGLKDFYEEIQRFNADGSVDTSYAGLSTRLSRQFPAGVPTSVAEPDGTMTFFVSLPFRPTGPTPVPTQYSQEGLLNASYQPNIAELYTCPGTTAPGTVGAIARQPDGKLVFVISISRPTDALLCFRRLNADGTLDFAFNNTARTITHGSIFNGLHVLSDGSFALVMGQQSGLRYNWPATVFWFDAQGNPNLSKGTNGSTPLRGDGTNVSGPAIAKVLGAAVQSNGKIVLAGYPIISNIFTGGSDGIGLPRAIRLDTQGNVDTSFGAGATGYADLNPPEALFTPTQVLVAADGSIFVLGSSLDLRLAVDQRISQITIVKIQGDAVTQPPPPPPPSTGNNTGGGGCGMVVKATNDVDPTLPALALAAIAYLLVRRRYAAR